MTMEMMIKNEIYPYFPSVSMLRILTFVNNVILTNRGANNETDIK